jgi:sulfate permease, SulP family
MSEYLKNLILLKDLKIAPFISTLKKYSLAKFKRDLIAGLTVAIVALPQSMAYAIIAGVNPKYGLYAAIIPTIMSSLFGSSKYLIAGPTNAISMVISSTLAATYIAGIAVNQLPEDQKIGMIFLLAFMVGLIQVAMGLAKFGSLINFVSHSVVVGFTAGAGVLIAFNQLKNLLGISIKPANEFIENLHLTIVHASEANVFAVVLGIFTIVLIIVFKKWFPRFPGPLLALITSAVIVFTFNLGDHGLKLIGDIPRRLPPFSSFPLDWTFFKALFPSAFAIALLGIVEALSISKSIANASGEKINGNQEFIGQGLSNITAAFFSSIPGSGSFTRSAVNFSSGARTRMAGAYSGLILLLVVLLLAPLARFIPIASLAGILMVIAYSMIDRKAIALSFKATKADRAVLIATMLSTLLLELEIAVYVGVILSIVLFLRKVSVPQVYKVMPRVIDNKLYRDCGDSRNCPQISIYQVEGALFFGAINELEERFHDLEEGKNKVIIMRMKSIHLLDATGAHALIKFLDVCKERKIQVILTGVLSDIRIVFDRLGIIDKVIIAKDTTEAISMAYRNEVDRSICDLCKKKVFKECSDRISKP